MSWSRVVVFVLTLFSAACAVVPYRPPHPQHPHAEVEVTVTHSQGRAGFLWRDLLQVDRRAVPTPRPTEDPTWTRVVRVSPGWRSFRLDAAHARYDVSMRAQRDCAMQSCAGSQLSSTPQTVARLEQTTAASCRTSLRANLRAGGRYHLRFEVEGDECSVACESRAGGPCS